MVIGETAGGTAALLLLTPSLTGYGTLWCWEGCVSQYLKYDFFYSYVRCYYGRLVTGIWELSVIFL